MRRGQKETWREEKRQSSQQERKTDEMNAGLEERRKERFRPRREKMAWREMDDRERRTGGEGRAASLAAVSRSAERGDGGGPP